MSIRDPSSCRPGVQFTPCGWAVVTQELSQTQPLHALDTWVGRFHDSLGVSVQVTDLDTHQDQVPSTLSCDPQSV